MSDFACGDSIVFHLSLRDESDVGVARRHTREVGRHQQLPNGAIEALATAVSEVARNALVHAHSGEVLIGAARRDDRAGVVVVVRDAGPGIPDLEAAFRDGYSTRGGLGMGLPSARRLVDEFELSSSEGTGTRVTLRQWAALEAAQAPQGAVGRRSPTR